MGVFHISSARELFELRLGMEAEAAAFAAERATPAQIAEIGQALEAMVGQLHALGEGGVEEDLRFHRAISQWQPTIAMYQSFLEFLERHLRQQLVLTRRNTATGWTDNPRSKRSIGGFSRRSPGMMRTPHGKRCAGICGVGSSGW